MSRIHSPIHREKRRKRKIRLIILAAVIFVALIGGSIYGIRNNRFVIDAVNVSGANFSDPQQIQSATLADISGNYLFVYPKASTFFYPKKKIESDILHTFPAVTGLTIDLQKNTSPTQPNLNITVKERVPFAVWCGDEIDTSMNMSTSSPDWSQCYFADSNGFIFSEAPHFSGTLYPIFYGGLSEATTTFTGSSTAIIGNSILTPPRLATIMNFAKNVGPVGFSVSAYQITEDPSGDICDLYYGTSTSSYLRVDCDSDFAQVATDLSTFITDPHFSTSTPAGYHYIDLRFGDKIVYKRK